MRSIIFTILFLGVFLKGYTQDVTFFNPNGFFSIGTQTNRTASITLCDIDKDGDLDALVANGRHWAEQNYLYYNDGFGGFKLGQRIGTFLDASYKIMSADFNNDGYMDIAVANDSRIENKIYFGNKEQTFLYGKPFGSKSPSRNMEIVDIDGDGDIDIILSNRKAKNEILLNYGNGNFTTIFFGKETDQTIQTKAIDINKDGLLDIVTAERNTTNNIYINNGTSVFSKTITFGKEEDGTRSIDIGDFNKDGFLDIVTGNLSAKNKIYYGDSMLTFKKQYVFRTKRVTASIKVADLNNDGFEDIVEGNFEDRNYVYLGSKSGEFQEVRLGEGLKKDTYHIEIGELNNDGFLDIVESNSGSYNFLYLTRTNN